ncbi:MAG: UDP-N-acetylmuramoyl-L-alanine--D-glutamate ligase [Azospirillum sp.]|nr:UDP-N-acetylmuramoyl-L-alanine--D-glutamate ligase [Azospirillum sp.]
MIDLFFLSGFPVGVMGLGRSGLATAWTLARSGAQVWAWDDDPARREAAVIRGIPIKDLHSCDFSELVLLVLSPGIPLTHPAPHPVAARARAAEIPIIGDIELLGRAQHEARTIGITGTNGKSTTTALIGHILKYAGQPVEVGGNLGTPALELAPLGANGSYVLEMSSYQLDLTFSIVFDVAVLLNLSPDHLDRHGGMDGYIAAKSQIFRGQKRPRTAVIGVDDSHSRALRDHLVTRGEQRVIPISAERKVAGGVYVIDGQLYDDSNGKLLEALDLREVASLPGRHNWQNAAAAYAACRAAGVHPAMIARCMATFPGLAHRQQLVAEFDGIRFVNDSKATNADAASKALACYEDIYWIVGGQAKAGGLAGLEPAIAKVRHAFLIGVAAEPFAGWLDGKVPYTRCIDLNAAVRQAAGRARMDRRGGEAKAPVVLLSPAGASFDQFTGFEARGNAFAAAVEALRRESEPC